MSGLQELDPWLFFSEIRLGPDGRMAIISRSRKAKPEGKASLEACIFCPEQRATLDTSYFTGDLEEFMKQKGIYVLENKYSAVSPTHSDSAKIQSHRELGVYYTRDIIKGKHLIMIESDAHQVDPFSVSTQTNEYYQNLVWGYVQMLRQLRDEGFSWTGIGKNRNGVDAQGNIIRAGASQSHPHSQAIALTMLQPRWWHAMDESIVIKDSEKLDMLPGCSPCFQARDHAHNPSVRIARDASYVSAVSLIPDPNPYHFEIALMPLQHTAFFEDMPQPEVFANLLHKTMQWLGQQGFGSCGYNFELRNGAWKTFGRQTSQLSYHWQFYIYPAVPELGTVRSHGFLSHLLGAAALTEAPEEIILRNRRRT